MLRAPGLGEGAREAVTPRSVTIALGLLITGMGQSAMAVNLTQLWDFNQPAVSEQRFRDALESASGDDALILQTQIARTYGLRQQFSEARELLRHIEASIAAAGPEARLRFALELGRTYASTTHPEALLTPENKELARSAYNTALAIARANHLDGLAIDSIHMMACVDTTPAEQLKWGQEALDVVEASTQPAAKQWEASIRNNIGYALHQLGRYEEALTQFEAAVVIRQRSANAQATRVAYWMVAWTLRALHRVEEALALQLRLEREGDAEGQPDPYVFEELEILYRAMGDVARAERYANRKRLAEK